MQLSPASRPTRVRRLLAVSAAAVAVMIAPTACDYGSYGSGSSSHGNSDDMGNMPGMDHGTPQHQEIVPVGNTVQSTADPAADDATETATAEVRSGDRRFRDGRHYRNRAHGQQSATAATIPPPADGATATATDTATATADPTDTVDPTATATTPPTQLPNNGLDVLGRDCKSGTNADLTVHNGFQSGNAECVTTEMGAVASEDHLPSLLITNAPQKVGVDQPFKLVISTRNLVRDRFLGAAAGGYYLESSFLDGNGLQRGHFHTACRMLASTNEAPDSAPAPAFFLATQDNGGGAAPDSVTIDVPATATAKAGVMQCTSWAGDGSHRTPMMSRANQTPAFDSVRILVTGTGGAEQENVSATDAQADVTKQAQAEQQQATAQKPDQDGATQPLPQGIGTAGDSATATETAAASTTTSAPAQN